MKKNKFLRIFLAIIIIVIIVILGIRLFSDEDTWFCQGGHWVKHGNPKSSEPTEKCE